MSNEGYFGGPQKKGSANRKLANNIIRLPRMGWLFKILSLGPPPHPTWSLPSWSHLRRKAGLPGHCGFRSRWERACLRAGVELSAPTGPLLSAPWLPTWL